MHCNCIVGLGNYRNQINKLVQSQNAQNKTNLPLSLAIRTITTKFSYNSKTKFEIVSVDFAKFFFLFERRFFFGDFFFEIFAFLKFQRQVVVLLLLKINKYWQQLSNLCNAHPMQIKTKLQKYFVTNVMYHVQYCYKSKQFVYTVSLSVTIVICYTTFILWNYFYSDKILVQRIISIWNILYNTVLCN